MARRTGSRLRLKAAKRRAKNPDVRVKKKPVRETSTGMTATRIDELSRPQPQR